MKLEQALEMSEGASFSETERLSWMNGVIYPISYFAAGGSLRGATPSIHIPTLHIPFHHLQQPSTFTANGADNKRLRGPEDAM